MKLIVATTLNPFVGGGSTYIVDSLEQALLAAGHEVETFRIPFDDHYSALLEQSLALRLIDLTQHGDRLITIRTPAHLLRHPRKIAWFIHHYRSAYDLWGTKYQALPANHEGEAIRRAIVASDTIALGEAAKVFSNSKVVAARLKKFNGIAAEVLYPPLIDNSIFRCDEYGDFVLYFSRLTHHKRQWLAIEAMRYTKTSVRLVIAGAPDPDCEPYVDELLRLIARYKLQDRVQLNANWVAEADKVDLYARCLAVVYFPFDEDSYGYPSLEAHAARKPVLTTTDAGGTIELIRDQENGFVTPPDPELIGAAMDRAYTDRTKTRRLGEAGLQRMSECRIDWVHVVQRLTS